MPQVIRLRTTGLTLSPEDLARASTAFEDAWTAIAAAYGRELSDHSAVECRQLARIVMDLVQGPMSPAEIAAASINRMRPLSS